MSFWIHAFCNNSVASVTPEEFKDGIAERLSLLTYLFCPDEEEDPHEVLARLKIENASTDGTFRVFLMRYRKGPPTFIQIERQSDMMTVEEVSEYVLKSPSDPKLVEVRDMLSRVKENVSFCLKASDVEAMGFPLSIAAASYLVQRAGGVIQSGSYSWMVPRGREVRMIAEVKR